MHSVSFCLKHALLKITLACGIALLGLANAFAEDDNLLSVKVIPQKYFGTYYIAGRGDVDAEEAFRSNPEIKAMVSISYRALKGIHRVTETYRGCSFLGKILGSGCEPAWIRNSKDIQVEPTVQADGSVQFSAELVKIIDGNEYGMESITVHTPKHGMFKFRVADDYKNKPASSRSIIGYGFFAIVEASKPILNRPQYLPAEMSPLVRQPLTTSDTRLNPYHGRVDVSKFPEIQEPIIYSNDNSYDSFTTLAGAHIERVSLSNGPSTGYKSEGRLDVSASWVNGQLIEAKYYKGDKDSAQFDFYADGTLRTIYKDQASWYAGGECVPSSDRVYYVLKNPHSINADGSNAIFESEHVDAGHVEKLCKGSGPKAPWVDQEVKKIKILAKRLHSNIIMRQAVQQ